MWHTGTAFKFHMGNYHGAKSCSRCSDSSHRNQVKVAIYPSQLVPLSLVVRPTVTLNATCETPSLERKLTRRGGRRRRNEPSGRPDSPWQLQVRVGAAHWHALDATGTVPGLDYLSRWAPVPVARPAGAAAERPVQTLELWYLTRMPVWARRMPTLT